MEDQRNNHCVDQEYTEEPTDSPKTTETTQELTPRQLRAFSVVAVGGTRQEAADKAGVQRRAVYDWERLPQWQTAMDALVRDARVLLILRLGDLLDDSTKALEQALKEPFASERKLLAARTVINSLLKLQEGK